VIGTYLLDASAYWRFRRELQTWAAWSQEITEGTACLCEATRVEVLRSARSPAERHQMRASRPVELGVLSRHCAIW
jgi:hypothetical protein